MELDGIRSGKVYIVTDHNELENLWGLMKSIIDGNVDGEENTTGTDLAINFKDGLERILTITDVWVQTLQKKSSTISVSDTDFAIVVIDRCIEESNSDEEILNVVGNMGLRLTSESIIELIKKARADKPSKETLEWEEIVPKEAVSDK